MSGTRITGQGGMRAASFMLVLAVLLAICLGFFSGCLCFFECDAGTDTEDTESELGNEVAKFLPLLIQRFEK